MLLNYLKLSVRLMARNPFFTFINVAGLSVGFAVFFVLWQYSRSELKSDQFHKDYERIYRIITHIEWTDDGNNWEGSLLAGGKYNFPEIVAKYTEIENQTAFFPQQWFGEPNTPGHGKDIFMSYISKEDVRVSYQETKVIYADPNFFKFFSFPLIKGSSEDVLSLPDGVAISETTAEKYFGTDDPVGKIIYLNNSIPFEIKGVFRDMPHHTHLNFDIVLSTVRLRNQFPGKFPFTSVSYLKLTKGVDVRELNERVNHSSAEELGNLLWDGWKGGKATIKLQPLKEAAFEIFRWDTHAAKSKYLLKIFSIAALIILVMAWINQLNLAIASGSKRFKELATRRTVGARTWDIIKQFMIEAILVNMVSLLLALTLVQLVKSPVEIFLQFQIPAWSEISMQTWLILVLILSSGILLTGSYLSILSIKRSPVSLFESQKARANNKTNGILTIVQFSSTCILALWIFAVNKQLAFVMNKDTGLVKDQVITLDLPVIPTEHFQSDVENVSNRVASLPGIDRSTISRSILPDLGSLINIGFGQNGIRVDTNGGVDEDFIPFYGIKLLAGRNFRADNPSDRKAIIISRGAMLRLGIENPEDAIGKELRWPVSEIIGVFEDYNLRPLIKGEDITYGGIPGIALTYKDFLVPDLKPLKISFRVTSGDFSETIKEVEKIYRSVFPVSIFNWNFLDEQINNQYQSDKTARNQILFFSALAMLIACLGLLGMISNKVVEKTKEIGIRKVLGAELYEIAQVLLNTTARQITTATIISIPVAYYLTQQYLDKFSERIGLQWWHFALPVVILVVIMSCTVATVVWKAAKSNPVDALKYE